MMRRGALIGILLCSVSALFAITVKVGVLHGKSSGTVIFSPINGIYTIKADSAQFTLTTQDLAYITYENGKISLKTLDGWKGVFNKLHIIGKEAGNSFKLKPVIPYGKLKAYDDDLMVTAGENQLVLVNEVDIDKYVAGVVKSEVGPGAVLEYYKVQAIICRTYAMSNFRRHEEEGFQLCDRVHCQVYGGKCNKVDPITGIRYTGIGDIVTAAGLTKNIVMVDHDLELINAAFHANCGGQTVNSEDGWSLYKSYLRSVKDTFCFSARSATWETEVTQEKWIEYLKSKYDYPVEDKDEKVLAIGFTQKDRLVYYCGRENILLKTLRSDWKLRSSYFSIEQKGSSLMLKGRGHGHGVGMCQQGAMLRAEANISYVDILNHYYQDISLIDMASLRYLLK